MLISAKVESPWSPDTGGGVEEELLYPEQDCLLTAGDCGGGGSHRFELKVQLTAAERRTYLKV